jgi:hypothetical protein
MPNPTIGKPVGPFTELVSTPGTIGELARCYVPLLANSPPRDVAGNVIGVPHSGTGGHGLGHAPELVPDAFAFNGHSDPALRFKVGSTAVKFPGRGFTATTVGRTMWAIFKPVYTQNKSMARRVIVAGSGHSDNFNGIGLMIWDNDTTINLGYFNISTVWQSGITITSGKTYAVSISNVSSNQWLLNAYCYDDDVYLTPSGTGTLFATGEPDTNPSAMASINPGPQFNGTSYPSFNGDVVAFGLSNGTFDPAINGYFAALIADPAVAARGVNAGGGALTAGGITNWDATTDHVVIHSNRPSGGTPAGYQYRLHGSQTPSFVPGVGTRIGALQSSPVFTDITITADETRWYRVEQTDGTSTVYSTTATTNQTQVSGRRTRGDFFFGVISDSRWVALGNNPPRILASTLRSYGYRTGYVVCGEGATHIYRPAVAGLSWQPSTTGAHSDLVNGQAGTSLLRQALDTFLVSGVEWALSVLGVNDAGTNPPSEIATRYDYIRDVIVSAGLKMLIVKPYLSMISEAATSDVVAYRAVMDAMADDVTTFTLGNLNVEHSESGLPALAHDFLHYDFDTMEGSAVAHDMIEILGGGPSAEAVYADAEDVRSGVNRGDGINGTLVIPDSDYVLSTQTFDNGTQGTLTLPPESQVLDGFTYGVGGNGSTGIHTEAPSPTYASASNVRDGVNRGDGVPGTLVVPSAANVLETVVFDNGTTGTAKLPAADKVLVNTVYGSGGNSLTGSLEPGIDIEIPTAEQIANAVRLNLANELSRIDTNIGSRHSSGAAVASVAAPVTVGTNNDKTGYSLDANGAALVTMPATLTGSPATWKLLQWIMFIGLRLLRSRKTKSTGEIQFYQPNQTTVAYTVATSNTDTEQTIGAPQ